MNRNYLWAVLATASMLCAPAFAQTAPATLPSQTLGPDTPLADSETALELGFAVAVSGNVALVGGPGEGLASPSIGIVGVVYEWVRAPSGTWTRGDTLTGSGLGFGSAIAMQGDRALIAGEARSGKAYYYVREKGHWKLRQVLTYAPAGSSESNSVTAVALDDCHAAVGSTNGVPVTNNPTSNGVVHIFNACGRPRGELALVATLTDTNDPQEGSFGASLSLDDRTLIIGEPGAEMGKGTVHIFEARGRHWTETQTIVSVDAQPGDSFGTSVALRDGLILVGAPGVNPSDAEGNMLAGAAYTFVRSRRGWSQRQTLIPAQSQQGWGGFGTSVAIGRDVLAVGAAFFLPLSILEQPEGRVFLLSREGNDYNFLDTLVQGPIAFGQSVAISGVTLLSGAPLALYGALQVGVISIGEADVYDISGLVPHHHE